MNLRPPISWGGKGPSSLSTKILLPLVALMLVALLVSTIAFVVGTAQTRNQLLANQATVEAERVQKALLQRLAEAQSAASMLARDPVVGMAIDQADDRSLDLLNSRAVVMRDRLNLHLVQIYNPEGLARVNLLLSSLYRESSLLDQISSDLPALHIIDGRALLLGAAAIPSGGTIVTGIDIETELLRLVTEYRLASDLGLDVDGIHVCTRDAHSTEGYYLKHFGFELGAMPVQLIISRPTGDMKQVTSAGLLVMVGSMLVTTLLLIVASVILTRSIVRPVHRLATAVAAVAQGDLGQYVGMDETHDPLRVGVGDEIGMLAEAFNGMVAELQDLYRNLEAKVTARTTELSTTADVARSVSASLDLQVILHTLANVVLERLDLNHVSIFLIEPESGRLVLRQVAGQPIPAFQVDVYWLTLDSGSMIGTAAVNGEPCTVLDAAADPVHLPAAGAIDAGAAAAVPLLAGRRVIGVLYAHSIRPNDLDEERIKLLVTLADQISVGIENARLYQESQTRMLELKRAQEQLIQSAKLAAVGELAAGVAHDFNNILTAIRGYADLILCEDGLCESVRSDLAQIGKASDRAASLTQQLLAFSRKQVLQPKVLDLNTVVRDTEGMLGRLIGEEIRLRTALDPALARVEIDPNQFHQVLINLVVNARDAMPRGGELTIETTNIYLNQTYARRHVDVSPGSYVRLAVHDTGVGMDQETQARIFEPFFTTKEKGTGLGLSTVYGIVKQSGGHIEFDTRMGAGTTFYVYLPRVDGAMDTHSPGIAPGTHRGIETILLVEDEDMLRQLARRILVRYDYQVLEAGSGDEALYIARHYQGEIHLLLTDVVMPGGMNGRELADRLAPERPEMRVLYMSGYTEDVTGPRGVLDPGLSFLQKPFNAEKLIRHVREVLDKPEPVAVAVARCN